MQGNYAYVGEGNHLTILDVSDRTKPTFVGKTSALTNALVSEVVMANGYVYATAKDDTSLYIVDVRQVTKPVIVGSVFVGQVNSGSSFPLFIASNMLYIGSQTEMALFDLSNPAQPLKVGTFVSSAEKIFVVGTAAYLLDGVNGLTIVDVSNPKLPLELGKSQFSYGAAIYVANNIVYVISYTGSFNSNKLTIFDVSNPTNIKQLSVMTLPPGNIQGIIALRGNYFYIDEVPSKLGIIDISDPTNPFKVGSVDAGSITDLALNSNTLYAVVDAKLGGSAASGLQAIDLSNPTVPKVVGSYNSVVPSAMQLVGNLAYVGTENGHLQVYDMSNLTNLTFLGQFSDTISYLVTDVKVTNNVAYMSGIDGWTYLGCRVIDVSNPSNLTILSPTCSNTVKYVANNIAYAFYKTIDSSSNTLDLINVSNPSTLVKVGSYLATGEIKEVYVTNNRAYVSVSSTTDGESMLILDVSNPATPTKLGEYKTSSPIKRIKVVGNTSYLLQDDKLRLVDVSSPNSPVSLGVFTFATAPYADMGILNNVVYIAGKFGSGVPEGKIIAIDVSNSSLPTQIDSYTLPVHDVSSGYVYNYLVEVQGNNVFVGVKGYGLYTFNLKAGPKPTPTPTPNITLQLSPSKLTFEATEGQSNPAAKPLNIAYVGTGSVSWSASSNATWLTVSQATGTTMSTVNVSVNTTGLKAATYNGQITISANGAKNSPQTVEVSLVVNPAPASSERLIDVTMSLYKAAPTAADRAPYERIMEYFADSVYELSNGAHKVRNVMIYQNGANANKANIVWNQYEWPRAFISSYGLEGLPVFMADGFAGKDQNGKFVVWHESLKDNNWQGTGYTLGHEWGHYYYGLYDEYKGNCLPDSWIGCPLSTDLPVTNSAMNSQWQARSGNFNWLNFSIAKNQTFQNAQYRVFGASGWETLARPITQDPHDGKRVGLPPRLYYPELAKVAPAAGQEPSIQLPAGQAQARSQLKISWATSNQRQTPAAYQATVLSLSGNEITYPQPVMLMASVMKNNPIAKAQLQAMASAPDGSTINLILKDDGIAPDAVANDGFYSGFMPYKQNGSYNVTVMFDNSTNSAVETQSGAHHAPGPNGELYVDVPQAITETFTASAFTNLLISGVKSDDYGDTTASATMLPLDNSILAGQIERANDVDMFQIMPTVTGNIALRVSNLALGMKPQVRVFKADGTTVFMEGNLTTNAHANGYLFLNMSVQANQKLYVAVSHVEATATQGLYDISAGAFLVNEQTAKSNTYLPLIVK